MSSYFCKIKIKSTGEIIDALALDDYFGKREYGYLPKDYIQENGEGKEAYHDYEVEELKDK